jgi:LysM repeat protein
LFVASVLALWLLIRPPSLPGESSGAIQPLPTTSPLALPTDSSPSPGASPEVSPSPEVTPAPTEAPAPTPIQYTMQEGDTVSGVAAAYGISYLDLLAVNGLTEEQALLLQPGDVIVIPQ